ncbi:MAG: hypothetical protein NVSMB21_17560 [Vulcanimicrobiaceae bacterium]
MRQHGLRCDRVAGRLARDRFRTRYEMRAVIRRLGARLRAEARRGRDHHHERADERAERLRESDHDATVRTETKTPPSSDAGRSHSLTHCIGLPAPPNDPTPFAVP